MTEPFAPLRPGGTHTVEIRLRDPAAPDETYEPVVREALADGQLAQAQADVQRTLMAPAAAPAARTGDHPPVSSGGPGGGPPPALPPHPAEAPQRFAESIGAGFVGAAKSLLAAPEAFGLVGADAPAGQALQAARQHLAGLEDTLDPADPTMVDRFGKAIGTAAFSFIPGLSAATVVQRATATVQGLARAAGWTGAVTSAGLEASQEMGQVFDELSTLVGKREAGRRAREVFGKNLALLSLTNKVGLFADVGRGAVRFLAGGLLEGAQEWLQYDITQRQFWLPSTSPLADQVAALGWTAQGDRLVAPVRPQDAAEAALFGFVLGGGMSAATGAALEAEGGSLQEVLQTAITPQEVTAGLALMGGGMAATRTTPPPQPALFRTADAPLRGAQTAAMQGMPLLDATTVQALRSFLRMTAAEQAGGLQIDGKPLEINYAHIQTDEGVKQVLAAVSDLYLDEIAQVRTPQTQAETAQAAQSLGITIEQFLSTPREELVSRKKARLGREMAVASARQLKVASNLFQHGALPGRDLLRVFATHVAIQTQFARLANEAGGALSTFAASVEGDISSLRGFERVMEYLGGKYTPEGLAAMIEAIPTQEQLTVFAAKAPQATLREMLLEAWYGSMFTPVTLFKNAFGNLSLLGDHYLNRVIAARLPGQQLGLQEALHRVQIADQPGLSADQKRAALASRTALFERDVVRGEANAFAAGVWHSTAEAFAAMKLAFQLSAPLEGQAKVPATAGPEVLLPSGQRIRQPAITGANVQQLGTAQRMVLEGPLAPLLSHSPLYQRLEGTAWDGLGMIARFISRGLIATDEFAKVLNKRGELAALAWRKAVLDQLVGDRSRAQVLDDMSDFLTNPPPAADELAQHRAAENTLTLPFHEMGAFGRAAGGLQDAAEYSLLWRYFAPFVRIATNSVYWNLERFPLTAPLLAQYRADVRAGGARADMARAKLSTGTLYTVMAAGLAWHGFLRGEGGEDRETRGLSESTGTRMYTLQIPGTAVQVPFKPIEPFAQFLGTMADWVTMGRHIMDDPGAMAEWSQVLVALVVAGSKNVFSQSWTQNMAEMSDLLFDRSATEEQLEGRFTRFVNRLGRLPVPGVVRHLETALDPEMSEVQTAIDAFWAGIPGVQKASELDFWGDPRTASTTGLGLELFVPLTPTVDKSLTYGPPTVAGMREALAQRDLDRLKVWVAEELLAAQIPVSRPSATLLPKQRGAQPQDQPIRLRPDDLNHLRTLFAKTITDGAGRTLPEALAAQMLTDTYQQGTDGANGSRALHIQPVVEAFKEAARARLLQEAQAPDSPRHALWQGYEQHRLARLGHKYNVQPPVRIGQ